MPVKQRRISNAEMCNVEIKGRVATTLRGWLAASGAGSGTSFLNYEHRALLL